MHIFTHRSIGLWSVGLVSLALGISSFPASAHGQQSGGPPRIASDPAFERYLNLDLLAQAWIDKNAALLTDVGLQLADGERVLFRSHASVTADQVLAMAARVAGEKKDIKTLARLAKALDSLKKPELAAEVAAARQLASVSRAPDPALAVSADKLSPEAFLVLRETLDSITSAKLAGDGETLDIIAQLTPQMTLVPETQRKFLIKTANEARASIDASDPAAAALNKLLEGSRDGSKNTSPAIDSTTLGVTYTPTHKGLRVTGTLEGGPRVLSKGAKLGKGDLILRVGNRVCYGDATDLDAMVTAASLAGNNELLVYDAKNRKVQILELPPAD